LAGYGQYSIRSAREFRFARAAPRAAMGSISCNQHSGGIPGCALILLSVHVDRV